jgi:hypothetical protein
LPVVVLFEKSAVPLPGYESRTRITLDEGTTVRGLLERYGGIGGEELYLLPVVNGEATHFDRVMRDGDRFSLFRLSAGG